jgi:hypothetical protein
MDFSFRKWGDFPCVMVWPGPIGIRISCGRFVPSCAGSTRVSPQPPESAGIAGSKPSDDDKR